MKTINISVLSIQKMVNEKYNNQTAKDYKDIADICKFLGINIQNNILEKFINIFESLLKKI